MKPRDRVVLAIVGLAGVMAALWFLALAPKREEATKAKERVAAAETRRDAALGTAAHAEAARAGYKRDYATVARIGKATPPQADVASLVYQLETAANQANVDFRSVALAQASDAAAATPAAAAPAAQGAKGAATGASGITPVPFTFVFDGKFFKLHDLLTAIDRFSRVRGQTIKIGGRLLTLDGVTIGVSRLGFPHVKVQIAARAYVAPIPDPLPAAATTAPTANTSPATEVTP